MDVPKVPVARSDRAGTRAPGDESEAPFAGAAFGTMFSVVDGLEAERHLQQARMIEIERSNADLEAFAGRAAHELRNCLAPVRLGCRILSGTPVTDVRLVVDAMNRSLVTAVTLIDALLLFSKVGAARGAGESGVVTTLGAVLEELRPTITSSGVELLLEVPEEGLWVGCDPGLLHIVMANVIGNAVKFLCRQELRQVRITASEDGVRVVLCVEDTGPGIPPEAMARLFEPFFRVPRTGIDGHGLGLATVRRILGSCGGRVRLDSEPARGTQVWIELPVASRIAPPRTVGP